MFRGSIWGIDNLTNWWEDRLTKVYANICNGIDVTFKRLKKILAVTEDSDT